MYTCMHQWKQSICSESALIIKCLLVTKGIYAFMYITSGKNFIEITSVGMGAAKSNETR